MNTTMINNLKNLGFIQWTSKSYKNQPVWQLSSKVSDLSFIYYESEKLLVTLRFPNKEGVVYGNDKEFVLNDPKDIQEVIDMINLAEESIKKEFKIGYTISESSKLFKYLRFLERSYPPGITLIGKNNGCPVFWTALFLTLSLPICYMCLLPIILWVPLAINAASDGDNKKAVLSFLVGGLWTCTTFPMFIYGLSIIINFFIEIESTSNFSLMLCKGFFVSFCITSVFLIIIVLLIYLWGMGASWNDKRMEKKQRRLNKLRNENTEFKTTGELISSVAIGFYKKHCPKLNWKYDVTNRKD